jgi:uncharacterized protein YcaQ
MAETVELSGAEARRIALVAQGFARPRPKAGANLGHVRRLVSRLGAVQIDAVNVLVRSHYLPAYSRLGPYRPELLDHLAYQLRAAFEYWGHAASFVPMDLYPALRWRMAHFDRHKRWAAARLRVESKRPGYVDQIMGEVSDRGPLTFGDLADPGRLAKPTKDVPPSALWWRWADGKTVLEWLYSTGRLAVAGRRGFERLYDLAERVIPADVLSLPAMEEDEAQRTLVRQAASALGVATLADLADYFRLPIATTRARIRELVDKGELGPAAVEGWSAGAYLAVDAIPSPVEDVRALLSPFDSLIWERARTQRLFGFRHSFELYVPAAKRVYGYYVLPFLLGDRLIARVDLKADRAAKALLVQGAFLEPSAQLRASAVAGELAVQLPEMAAWLGLERVTVSSRGDLAAPLKRSLR